LIVKSCSDGYDGKAQWRLKTLSDAQAFDEQYSASGIGDIIIEKMIPFEREVSLVSVRSSKGEIKHYPLAENHHRQGILEQSIVPAPQLDDALVQQAQSYMEKLLSELNYVGVLAMECFQCEGELLVNELAPRVHNSGHWSQLGSVTGQFENHVRAISGLALGSTRCHGVAAMYNLIGNAQAPIEALSGDSSLHWYGKSVRAGRKLGHVNFIADDYASLSDQLDSFQQHTHPDNRNQY